MASVYKPVGGSGKVSKYWHGCFYIPGPDGRQVMKRATTKLTDRRRALELVVAWERAGRIAGEGRLTQGKSREILASIMEISTGEKLEEFTAGGWLTSWLEIKAANASPATMVRYRAVINKFIAFLGERAKKPLEHIRSADVVNFQAAESAGGRSAMTVNLAIKTIAQAFRAAQKRGVLRDNPVAPLERVKDGQESTGRTPFTREEVEALQSAADGEWKGVILAGICTGARLGDIARLEWSSVDLKAGVIRLRPEKTKRSSRAVLTIPILPQLAELLRSLPSPDNPSAPVFPGLAGKTVGGANGLSNLFKRIMKRAGIDGGFSRHKSGTAGRSVVAKSFHSLRHSMNSWLHAAGVTQEIRMKLMGHSSASMNTVYTHSEVEVLREAMNRLSFGGSGE